MTYEVFLPFIIKQSKISHVKLGCQFWGGVDRAKWLVPGAVVHRPIWWYEHETTAGYDWSAIDEFVNVVSGYDIIFGVKNAPEWYRTRPDVECSEPTEEGKEAYINFVDLLVDRYSPWGIEVWNEWDSPKDVDPYFSKFLGCWGDDYPAGLSYGMFVDKVSDQIRDKTNVLGGAFGWAMETPDTLFGFLDATTNYDYLSYHHYSKAKYNQTYLNFRARCDFINTYTDKPLICTETSYLYGYDVACEGLEMEQMMYLQNILMNCPEYLKMILWFTLAGNDWENSDLVDNEPKPVYQVWRDFIDAN